MSKVLKRKLTYAIAMLGDVTKHLASEDYAKDLRGLPSNTIGEQLWCLAGARESYIKAIKSDGSFEWNCCLDYEKANSKPDIDRYLDLQGKEAITVLNGLSDFTENQMDLALDLMSHEFQHQGQMIRYIYANKVGVPGSWKEFWHLD